MSTKHPPNDVHGSYTSKNATTSPRDPPTLQLYDFESTQQRLNERAMNLLGAKSPKTRSNGFYVWLGQRASRFLLGTTDTDRLL